MPELESTPAFSVGKSGIRSAIRHTIMPLFVGSTVAALQTAQSGSLDVAAMKSAAITSAIAGVVRLLQVFAMPHDGVR